MRTRVGSLAISLALLAGCGASEPPVDWGGKYSPTVKKRLDALIKAKDCDSLGAELETAYAINEAKKRQYGTGSADLVKYIKYGLDQADCDD